MGELPILVISHPKVRSAIALQGAHLLSWKPAGQQPAIWLSDKTPFVSGKAIRGGVPVCWPWFGPAKQQGLPAHGFARNQPWTLKAHDDNEDASVVVLTFTLQSSDAQTKKLWPHDFTLLARFRIAEHCEIELEARGDYETTAALHTYFQVADIAQVEVSGLGNSYIDKVQDNAIGSAADGKQTYPERVDRIHTAAEDCSVIHDRAGKRQIEVYHHYQSDVVTWNPGPALSCSMADMPNDGYKTMVCVETARINKPMKSAGETPARLGVTLRIRNK